VAPELRNCQSALFYPYPALRRMAAPLPPPNFSVDIKLTPEAAERLNKHPEVLLHHRLYNMASLGRDFLYKVGEDAVCVVQTVDFFDLGSLGKPSRGEVLVFAPGEKEEGKQIEEVTLGVDYPSFLLPFDLTMMKAIMEIGPRPPLPRILRGDQSEVIYLGACPFEVYRAFHQLTRFSSDLQAKMQGLHRVVEVGSGLGVMSFVASCLLPRAEVRAVELDTTLIMQSGQIKSFLGKNGFKFPNVVLRRGDISDRTVAEIETADALMGFFPLTQGEDGWVVEVFQRLPKGALVFQLHHEQPLTADNALQLGFKKIESLTYPEFPFYVFERI
jgi:hypothetical protein